MTEIVVKILEDSVLAGGFFLLLYYFINEQKTILREFAKELRASNEVQMQISNTLTRFDERLQALERGGE